MSNSYNNSGMLVNPILSTFPADEINIQPYWTVVLGLFVSQLFQRIWHFIKYRTGFTTLEIAGLIGIFQKRLQNRNKRNGSVPVAFAEANTGRMSGIRRIKMRKCPSLFLIERTLDRLKFFVGRIRFAEDNWVPDLKTQPFQFVFFHHCCI